MCTAEREGEMRGVRGKAVMFACVVGLCVGCGARTARPRAGIRTSIEVLAPAPSWVSDRLSRSVPHIIFEVDEYEPGEHELQGLARMASALRELYREFPSLVIVIQGHCDDSGSAKYNMRLGARRARAVREALVRLGVPAAHLRVVSFGHTRPVCTEEDSVCRARNRRVEFRVARGETEVVQ